MELLRRNPQLAAALLASAGVRVPAGAGAVLADSNLSVPEPTELRADVVTVHEGVGRKIVIVTEVQKDPPDGDKHRAWACLRRGATRPLPPGPLRRSLPPELPRAVPRRKLVISSP